MCPKLLSHAHPTFVTSVTFSHARQGARPIFCHTFVPFVTGSAGTSVALPMPCLVMTVCYRSGTPPPWHTVAGPGLRKRTNAVAVAAECLCRLLY